MQKNARGPWPAAAFLLLSAALFECAGAEESTETVTPNAQASPVVVTATRVETPSFDVGASIDAIGESRIQDAQPQVNLSETLVTIPGVVANNRQNYAQDLQISIRGFGARSTFGVRGIRLYMDGIPATMPDGQGQVSNFDLGSARRIEVLRGPFSALYGNSSGGVIQIFTEDGPESPTVTGDASAGSFDSYRGALKLGGTAGSANYLVSGSHFQTEGFRDHSAAKRETVNGKVRFDLGSGSTLTVVGNTFDTPEALDPLGLTKAQAEADPKQAVSQATQFNTRKSILNNQGGLVYDLHLTDQDSIRTMVYVGTRRITQYLGFSGAAPTSSGGVVDLDRQFGGLDARYTRQGTVASLPLTFSLGLNYDRSKENRRGFVNNNGIGGALRRDEDDTVFNFDQYVQAELGVTDWMSVSAGLRNSRVAFKSEDFYINAASPNDSGDVVYNSTNPVAGVLFRITPTLNAYANFGRGFETPTFSELAYRPPGAGTGLNFGLQPSKSKNYEIGVKSFVGTATRVNAALFQINTENEIVVLANFGGRTVYQNAGKTRRRGLEVSADSQLPRGFGLYGAYTYLNAEYSEAFCSGSTALPCPAGNLIPSGNALPGVPQNLFYGEVSWSTAGKGFSTALEARYSDKIYVNDTNSDFADAYWVLSWRASLKQAVGRWRFSEFARIDNLLDERYIGSVIVNESNGRYFEPSPGASFTIGATASYQF